MVKISSDCEVVSRENANYDRVTSGLFKGSFVRKIEHVTEINGAGAFAKKCALVTEAGQTDLHDALAKLGGRGLEGQALRDAAV